MDEDEYEDLLELDEAFGREDEYEQDTLPDTSPPDGKPEEVATTHLQSTGITARFHRYFSKGCD